MNGFRGLRRTGGSTARRGMTPRIVQIALIGGVNNSYFTHWPPHRNPFPGRPGGFERFLKNRSRGRQATPTLSTAFPNSRCRTPPLSARGIRADARAYTPARDGGLRERACSTAFPGQPAKAKPSRPCEISRRGLPHRRAPQRAALSANPARACCGVQCARFSCGGAFR